jgi:type IV pilus assembly protein PilV
MTSLPGNTQGFTLIEVLVTFVIIAIGLLGLAALQVNTMNGQFEAYQRSMVTALVDDMAARIRVNPTDAKAGSYTAQSGAYYGLQSTSTDCSALAAAARDLCDWNAAIAGASTQSGGTNVGAPLGARGCIELGPASGSGETVLRVSVAWQGISPSVAPAIDCGENAFGDESYRRVVFRDVAVR